MVSQPTGEVLAPLRPRRQSTAGGAPEPRPGGGPGGDAGGPGRPGETGPWAPGKGAENGGNYGKFMGKCGKM